MVHDNIFRDNLDHCGKTNAPGGGDWGTTTIQRNLFLRCGMVEGGCGRGRVVRVLLRHL